jgi:hypothetical protein
MTLLIRRTTTNLRVIGQLEGVEQQLMIATAVLMHVCKHWQLSPRSKESGGQLFGKISSDKIHVVKASGPYRGDERSRYRYRSNASAAQSAICRHAQEGLL